MAVDLRRAAVALSSIVVAAATAPAERADAVELRLPLPGLPPLPSLAGSPPGAGADCKGAAARAGVDPRGVDPGGPNPLAGERFFVDPEEHAWLQTQSYASQGRRAEAQLMWKVARQPRFKWFGRWTRPNMQLKVRKYLERVRCTEPGAVPLMAVMRHQGKDCGGGYDAGGAAEDALTRQWYDDFAKTVGDARVVIAFEPDSLGTIDCLTGSRRRARLDTLRFGVDVLSRLPRATIYLEAGASDWEPAARTARQLRYIGIHKVRGFMLNVTHYDWTANNVEHGRDISRRVGGKPFIISTHFNGRGPVHFRRWINRRKNKWRTINVWCHPLKRGLGPVPTTATGKAKVDGYMWIGRPGYSGGSCNGGPLPVGTWWPERALELARHATAWERPPRGTRNGHFARYGLRQLGGRAAAVPAVSAGQSRLEAEKGGAGRPVAPTTLIDVNRRALSSDPGTATGLEPGQELGAELPAGSRARPGPLPTGGYLGGGLSAPPGAVRSLQRLLSETHQRVEVDGVFGTETEAAVRRFQRSHGLIVDGVVGMQTMSALGEYRGG